MRLLVQRSFEEVLTVYIKYVSLPDSSLHHHHVPLSVRCDVWRPRPRDGNESLCLVDGADGKKAEEETIQ